MKSSLIMCGSCKHKDSNNIFKLNKVNINANVVSDGVTLTVNNTFECICTKCSKCNKVLFSSNLKYKRYKKQFELYFKTNYNVDKVSLTGINIKL